MFNKITILAFVVCGILYLVLRYANSDAHVVDFVGGMLIGMLISFVGTAISKLFKKKKKTSPEE